MEVCVTRLLYHYPYSLCSQKVRLALAELGLPWEGRVVDIGPAMENYEAWYCRINPRMVVPTLVDSGEVITDSTRILRHLGSVGGRLYPEDEQEEIDRWIDTADALSLRELSYERFGGLLGWLAAWSFTRRARVLARQAEAHPELAEHYRARLEDVEQWSALREDVAALRRLEREVEERLDEVDAALAARPWIAGPRYSLADVIWTVVAARLQALGMGESLARRRHLARWWRRVRARPSFATAGVVDRVEPAQVLRTLAPDWLPRLLALMGLALAVWIGLGRWKRSRR